MAGFPTQLNGGIPDAPIDSRIYGRQNAAWVNLNISSGSGSGSGSGGGGGNSDNLYSNGIDSLASIGAIGFGNISSGDNSVAIGYGANGGMYGTSIGFNSNGSLLGASFGYYSDGDTNGAAFGYQAIAYSYGSSLGSSSIGNSYGTAIGCSTNGSNYGVAAGIYANGSNYGASIGSYCVANNYGTAIGYNSMGYTNGTSIGSGSSGFNSGVAIGVGALGANYSVSIGNMVGASIPGRIEIATVNNSLSVKSRISADTNGQFYTTAQITDSAPTAAGSSSFFGNSDGTLPQGMWGVRVNSTETAIKFFYTTLAGVVKTATIPIA